MFPSGGSVYLGWGRGYKRLAQFETKLFYKKLCRQQLFCLHQKTMTRNLLIINILLVWRSFEDCNIGKG